MKYPGDISDPAQQDWFDRMSSKYGVTRIITGDGKSNPCIALHGPGPADKRCKDCALCYYNQFSKRYYKCELRGSTRGPATDHRANWPTCGKFQPQPAQPV